MSATAEPSPLNLPNLLTVLRVLAVPLFGWMLLAHPHEVDWRWATTVVFVLAILTDLVDGKLARRYGLVTRFGKLADPIADKAITGMAFIGLSVLGELWWWVTIVILVREWGITLLRLAIVRYGVMAANKGGKTKTLVQSLALVLMLPLLHGAWRWPGWVCMAVALVLTVVTGVGYCLEAWRMRQRCQDGQR